MKAKRKRAPSIEAARRAAFKAEVKEREKLKKDPLFEGIRQHNSRLSRKTS